MNSTDRPLISFVILSYNQEKYIKEAVTGALNQTYSPLEIIISDDQSSDHTFEIIKDTVKSYTGPHTVRTNCNERNLGIAAHMNRVVGMASGELIIGNAGDDISFSNRAERIFSEWRNSDKNAFSIYSNMLKIDESGMEHGKWNISGIEQHSKSIDDVIRRKIVWLYGCTHAFSKKVFTVFGNIDDNIIHEDEIIPFRSLILGEIKYIDEPLLYYRQHESNVWNVGREIPYKEYRFKNKKMQNDRLGCCNNWIKDLNTAYRKNIIDKTKCLKYIEELNFYKEDELKFDLIFSDKHPVLTIWHVLWLQITFHKMRRKAVYSWLQNSLPPLWYSIFMGKLFKMKIIKSKYYETSSRKTDTT